MPFNENGQLVCGKCGEKLFHEQRVFRVKKGELGEVRKEPAGVMIVCSFCGSAVGAAPNSSTACIKFVSD